MKRRVLIDMDGVVVDLLGSWLRLLERATGTRLSRSDIHTYYFPRTLDPELRRAAMDIVRDGLVFTRATPIPGGLEACRALDHEGFDVRFATMALTGSVCAAKVDWIRHHLGWGPDRVMLTHAKHWISAHYAVDDCPDYLRSFAEVRDASGGDWPRVIGFPHPYNRCELDLRDVCDLWAEPGIDDPEPTWDEIVRRITTDAKVRS